MTNRVISAVLTFKDQNFASGMRKANKQAGDFGREVNVVQNKIENFKKSATNAFKTVGKSSMALGAAGVTAFGASVAKTVLDMDSSFSKLKAQTGAMGTDLKVLEGAAKETFARGYGENLDEVTNALSRVKQNMHNLDNGELSNVTSNAMLLANTFDSDVNEVTRGVNNTMQAFGVSAEKAFDLFTAGGQRGLNFSNEMFDNVAEYASLFGEMGYSAEEYFGILERGSLAGVYNLDYVNDVMKEFQIRVKDGSKSTSNAMKDMSKDTQNVWKEFLKGNGTVSDVASTVVAELKKMDDQVAAGQIGVSLFGTKFEDLEADAMYAMLGTTDAMKDFEGATSIAAKSVEGGFVNRMKSGFRDLTVSIASLADNPEGKQFLDSIATTAENMIPKITNVAQKAIEFGNTIKTHWTPIKETVIGITVAVAAFKTGMTAMTIVSTITGFVKSYRTALATGTAAQWAMNAAMSANPIGLVIGAVAGLAAGFVLLYRNSEKFRGAWDRTWDIIKRSAETGVNAVIGTLNKMIDLINKIPGVNIPVIPKVDWSNVSTMPMQDGKRYTPSMNMQTPQIAASYDIGSNRIGQDHIAQVHKDEMIIPARQAEKVRQAGGTIDNIDKLINKQPQTITTSNNPQTNGGVTFGDINIYPKGLTSTEVVNDTVQQLKLALSNM